MLKLRMLSSPKLRTFAAGPKLIFAVGPQIIFAAGPQIKDGVGSGFAGETARTRQRRSESPQPHRVGNPAASFAADEEAKRRHQGPMNAMLNPL
jgi:hypothetical protein